MRASAFLLSVAGFHLATAFAQACECLSTTEAEVIARHPFVFEGRVEFVTLADKEGRERRLSVRVLRRIKGHPPAPVTVRIPGSGPACGWAAAPGARYVFAIDARGRTDRCIVQPLNPEWPSPLGAGGIPTQRPATEPKP